MVYTIPLIFLPVDSVVPAAIGASPAFDPATLGQLLQAAAREAASLRERLDNRVLANFQLPGLCQGLVGLLEATTELLDGELASLEQWVETGHPEIHSQPGADLNSPMAEHYRIYDDYFRVRRLPGMTLPQFIGQAAICCRRLLLDLPYTQLDCHQLGNLLDTLGLMMEEFAAHYPADPVAAPPAVRSSEAHRAYARCWGEAVAETAQWSADIAFFRWRLGHHYFNLCNIIARDLLCRVAADPEAPDAPGQLQRAGVLLRGTTFAMWYAGNFMPGLYETVVRPSMVMPGSKAGFSGDQNFDYNNFKHVKNDLLDHLRQRYPGDMAQRAPRLYQALVSFQEADLVDKEHHLVLVAAKVGTAQSLSQQVWQAELPPEVPQLSAVDILREMLQAQREELIR